jgi:hypothetical protein
MNSLKEACDKLLELFLKEDENGPGMTARDIVEKLLPTFKKVETEKNLQLWTKVSLRKHYRTNFNKSKKMARYKVKLRFELEDSKKITPSHTDWCNDTNELRYFHSGSTVVFDRKFLGVRYYHTAILFKGDDGETALMEIDGSYLPARPFVLKLSSPDDVFWRGQTDSQNPMKIDNREVKDCTINIYQQKQGYV